MIITKRADELKPGDILVTVDSRKVVMHTETSDGFAQVICSTVALGPISMSTAHPVDTLLDVEVPDLTPAQERAEELAELLRRAVKWATTPRESSNWAAAARVLLDEIDPPKPPTLGEVLLALMDAEPLINMDPEDAVGGPAHTSKVSDNARDIIERARKAGLIK